MLDMVEYERRTKMYVQEAGGYRRGWFEERRESEVANVQWQRMLTLARLKQRVEKEGLVSSMRLLVRWRDEEEEEECVFLVN